MSESAESMQWNAKTTSWLMFSFERVSGEWIQNLCYLLRKNPLNWMDLRRADPVMLGRAASSTRQSMPVMDVTLE